MNTSSEDAIQTSIVFCDCIAKYYYLLSESGFVSLDKL